MSKEVFQIAPQHTQGLSLESSSLGVASGCISVVVTRQRTSTLCRSKRRAEETRAPRVCEEEKRQGEGKKISSSFKTRGSRLVTHQMDTYTGMYTCATGMHTSAAVYIPGPQVCILYPYTTPRYAYAREKRLILHIIDSIRHSRGSMHTVPPPPLARYVRRNQRASLTERMHTTFYGMHKNLELSFASEQFP